ncbi:hypothetical protein M2436_007200 [Streptomyces sp. HB372]|nr:hypothetical protein [Streptomyces sp. HB372]
MHGGLGDAVHVDELGAVVAVPLEPAGEPSGVERLTSEDHGAQGGFDLLGGSEQDVGELVEGGRGLVEHGDVFAAQEGGELLGRAGRGMVHDDEASAVQQGPEDLPDGEVEGVTVEERPHVVRAEPEVVVGRVQQPQHIVVFDDHALGASGGAGGVDDVGGGVRGDGGGGVRGVARGRRREVVEGQPSRAGAVGGSVGGGQAVPLPRSGGESGHRSCGG